MYRLGDTAEHGNSVECVIGGTLLSFAKTHVFLFFFIWTESYTSCGFIYFKQILLLIFTLDFKYNVSL